MITGSLVALVTPMFANGDIDWDTLDKLVDFHVEKGTSCIVAVGTTGESATLDCDEHLAVIKRTISRVDGRIPVMAGTGANSTSEAIELTRAAKDAGADACLLVTPYYNRPTQEGLYQHFKAIAEAVDVPQVLYNVPSRTACDMASETSLRLAELTNIVGIKDATGDLTRGKELIDNAPEGFAIYSGDDETAPELMLLGGHGNISVTANLVPDQMSELCKLAMAGEADATRALQNELLPLHNVMFVEPNPVPVKWAMGEMGLMNDTLRLPLVTLSESLHTQVSDVLKAKNLI